MKNAKTVLSALALASASVFAPSAIAGKIENVNQQIVLVDNQAMIEHQLTGGNAGATFSDRYRFTTEYAADLNAVLAPRAASANSKQAITGFSLFDSQAKFVANSSVELAGSGEWLINFDNLAAGAYYLQVNGALKSNAAFKYLANLSIGPQQAVAVAEQAPAALMLAGMGLLGMMARRRQAKARPSA